MSESEGGKVSGWMGWVGGCVVGGWMSWVGGWVGGWMT